MENHEPPEPCNILQQDDGSLGLHRFLFVCSCSHVVGNVASTFAFCNYFTVCFRRVRPLQGCRSSPSLRGSPRHCIALLDRHFILLLHASALFGISMPLRLHGMFQCHSSEPLSCPQCVTP